MFNLEKKPTTNNMGKSTLAFVHSLECQAVTVIEPLRIGSIKTQLIAFIRENLKHNTTQFMLTFVIDLCQLRCLIRHE